MSSLSTPSKPLVAIRTRVELLAIIIPHVYKRFDRASNGDCLQYAFISPL